MEGTSKEPMSNVTVPRMMLRGFLWGRERGQGQGTGTRHRGRERGHGTIAWHGRVAHGTFCDAVVQSVEISALQAVLLKVADGREMKSSATQARCLPRGPHTLGGPGRE